MRINRIAPASSNEIENTVDLSLLAPIIEQYRKKGSSIIALLQAVQSVYSYLPKVALQEIERELNHPTSELYAVATFYAQFKLKPSGKHSIKVCKGTACHVQNASSIIRSLEDHLSIKEDETTPDGLYTLESVSCLGCCSLAPAMMIGEDTFGKLDEKSAVDALKKYT